MGTKICHQCGKGYFRKQRFSLKWWATSKFCSVACSSKSKVGKPGGMRGKRQTEGAKIKIRSYRHSDIARRKIGLASIGNRYRKGHKNTEQWKTMMHVRMSGKNNHRWIADRTIALEKHRLRSSRGWRDWRMSVFERDLYTCRECGSSGVYLEPHHINPLRLGGVTFDINNGITLCRPCHVATMGKEQHFAERYYAMILPKV